MPPWRSALLRRSWTMSIARAMCCAARPGRRLSRVSPNMRRSLMRSHHSPKGWRSWHCVSSSFKVAGGQRMIRSSMFNIVEFGAKDDRHFNSGTAIQEAIDACAQAGGGTVVVPAGDFLSGTLQLKRQVTLCLKTGATLWASTDASDYTEKNDYDNAGRFRVGALLVARDADHIGIEGEGVIHGLRVADYGVRGGVTEILPFRTGIILF